MAFIALWMFVVYFPLAHMVWGIDGFMNGVWNADAGDQGDRLRGRHRRPHVLGLVGADPLPDPRQAHRLRQDAVPAAQPGADAWSAPACSGSAGTASTPAARSPPTASPPTPSRPRRSPTAVAAFVWPALEWITRGKPSVLGFCSGAVAGLVVITPAAASSPPTARCIIGVLAGVVPFFACTKLKAMLRVRRRARHLRRPRRRRHARRARSPASSRRPTSTRTSTPTSSDIVGKTLWLEQLKAIGLTLVLAIVGTVVIATAIKRVIGLRASTEAEEAGLDDEDHGESGYHADEAGHGGLEEIEVPSLAPAPIAATTR